MALLQVSQHLLNDPQSIKAIYHTFDSVEEVNSPIESLYKTFRVTGQGVPLDDKQIIVGFEHGLDGNTKITGWSFSN
jgi:hypothetical protein